MKKVVCLLICFVTLFLVCFSASAGTIQPNQTFTPTTTNLTGGKVQTGSYNCAGKKGYYSYIKVTLSVTYMRYDVQNHTGIYTNGNTASTSSNNPGKATGSITAFVSPRNAQDSRLGVNATVKTWTVSVNR